MIQTYTLDTLTVTIVGGDEGTVIVDDNEGRELYRDDYRIRSGHVITRTGERTGMPAPALGDVSNLMAYLVSGAIHGMSAGV